MSKTVCIIDKDLATADELAAILEDHGREGSVGIAANVPAAKDILWKGAVDLLFIRIPDRDDYRLLHPGRARAAHRKF